MPNSPDLICKNPYLDKNGNPFCIMQPTKYFPKGQPIYCKSLDAMTRCEETRSKTDHGTPDEVSDIPDNIHDFPIGGIRI